MSIYNYIVKFEAAERTVTLPCQKRKKLSWRQEVNDMKTRRFQFISSINSFTSSQSFLHFH